MKKLLITALMGLFLLGVTSTAKAIVLAPGGGPIGPTGAAVPLGGFVTTITQPIAYDNIAGSVTQNVYLNGAGYLFEYQFTNFPSPASINAIWRMTATNYSGFTTDVDAQAGTGVMPIWLDRSLAGDSVGFQFFAFGGGSGIVPGSTSAKLWIQTNAQYYGLGTANFINGGVTSVPMFGPAIPEPASMMLLGFGVLGLFGLKRKS